jgi:hypothetical protein
MARVPEEIQRLHSNTTGPVPPWYRWGPYLAERAWGTVREDYSANGDAWRYFTHEMAAHKAYRWGEDGIAGLCDRYQVAALSFAFWNHKDPILKERFFGLTSEEGNHGEDVKEYYFYLDNTPTHSYMKYLYKYSQNEYPYQRLIDENRKRGLLEPEFELSETGVFDQGKYFDITIEYAKIDPEDIAIRVTIVNHSSEIATLDFLPQVVFRNTHSASKGHEIYRGDGGECELLVLDDTKAGNVSLLTFDYSLGKRYFYGQKGAEALFTNNITHKEKLLGQASESPYVKDAFHRYIIHKENCIAPDGRGTKACLHYKNIEIGPKESKEFLFRFSDKPQKKPLNDVAKYINLRKKEADSFYDSIHKKYHNPEVKRVQREALSSLLWSKQSYNFDVQRWLTGDETISPPACRKDIRNNHWRHLVSKRVMLMPDKWEYPWFAAWDLAFHTVTCALVDLEFAKNQIWLLLFDQFQHPNGQIPAYEWEFSDLNPPVQAWAALELFNMGFEKTGRKDYAFLKKCFHKMMINFVWWVNKVDSSGNNIFEGGFLGLDNITVIDRSMKLPGGGKLEQSDGTGWMGFFSLKLMRIAIELSLHDKDYESLAVKFFEHFLYIGAALHKSGSREVQIWDEADGFFYDVIAKPDGTQQKIAVRSLVGIIPIFAIDFIPMELLEKLPDFKTNIQWFLKHRQDLAEHCITDCNEFGKKGFMMSLMHLGQMKRVLARAWDPNEFRSQYGLRSLSKYHEDHPFTLFNQTVKYTPNESSMKIKGGNSNWRGPIWFPTNYLFLETLEKLYHIFGDYLKVEDHQSKKEVTCQEMLSVFANSLLNLFLKAGKERPIHGADRLFKEDEAFRDQILFYEYFNGDTGRGLGASHQTGWTALIANIIDRWI